MYKRTSTVSKEIDNKPSENRKSIPDKSPYNPEKEIPATMIKPKR